MTDQKTFSTLAAQVQEEHSIKEPMSLSTYMRSYKDLFSNNPTASIKPEAEPSKSNKEKPEGNDAVEPPLDCPCRLNKPVESVVKNEEKIEEFNLGNLNEFSFQTGFFGFPLNFGQNLNSYDFSSSSNSSFNAFPSFPLENQFGSSFGYGFF